MENSELSEQRRSELINSLQSASFHGLPIKKYGVNKLVSKLTSLESLYDKGFLEGMFMISFTEYASDISNGVLVPSEIDSDIVRQLGSEGPIFYIQDLISSNPYDYFRSLGPN